MQSLVHADRNDSDFINFVLFSLGARGKFGLLALKTGAYIVMDMEFRLNNNNGDIGNSAELSAYLQVQYSGYERAQRYPTALIDYARLLGPGSNHQQEIGSR